MGKGFNNYMSKKFFHPASRNNMKKVWMAEQKTEAYKKKKEDLQVQYEKEQDLYNNKALLWKDSKDKLTLNFMYETPPGLVKENTKDDPDKKEDSNKLKWQRVQNVPCIKCHKWAHLNTDKKCSSFIKSAEDFDTAIATRMDPLVLMEQMKGYEKDIEFLQKLDVSEQMKILKSLKKLVKKQGKGADIKKKLKKIKKKNFTPTINRTNSL